MNNLILQSNNVIKDLHVLESYNNYAKIIGTCDEIATEGTKLDNFKEKAKKVWKFICEKIKMLFNFFKQMILKLKTKSRELLKKRKEEYLMLESGKATEAIDIDSDEYKRKREVANNVGELRKYDEQISEIHYENIGSLYDISFKYTLDVRDFGKASNIETLFNDAISKNKDALKNRVERIRDSSSEFVLSKRSVNSYVPSEGYIDVVNKIVERYESVLSELKNYIEKRSREIEQSDDEDPGLSQIMDYYESAVRKFNIISAMSNKAMSNIIK